MTKKIFCDLCGKEAEEKDVTMKTVYAERQYFGNKDSRLAVVSKDYCTYCQDKIVEAITKLAREHGETGDENKGV